MPKRVKGITSQHIYEKLEHVAYDSYRPAIEYCQQLNMAYRPEDGAYWHMFRWHYAGETYNIAFARAGSSRSLSALDQRSVRVIIRMERDGLNVKTLLYTKPHEELGEVLLLLRSLTEKP